MKKLLQIAMVALLLVSCGKKEGGSSASKAPAVIDSRLYQGTGVWVSYDPAENIEETFVVTDYGKTQWRINYRQGSVLEDRTYDLTALTSASLQIAWDLYPGDATYQFEYSINGDTLTLCQGAICENYTRQ